MTLARLVFALWLVLAGCLFSARSASAHAELRDADPAPNGTAPEGLEEISLQLISFSPDEGVSVSVVDEEENDVVADAPEIDRRDGTITVAVEPLEPGIHLVLWSATSADDDGISTGSYTFVVEEGPSNGFGVVLLWAVAVGVPAALFARSWLKKRG